jgi:HemY protein
VSPVTGRLDAFQWKDPVADLDADEALIEHERELKPVNAAVSDAPPPPPPVSEIKPPEPKPVDVTPPAPPPPSGIGRGLARTAPPIIPLIHVPDDPGPDPQPQLEPDTENAASSNDSWRKLRGLFK